MERVPGNCSYVLAVRRAGMRRQFFANKIDNTSTVRKYTVGNTAMSIRSNVFAAIRNATPRLRMEPSSATVIASSVVSPTERDSPKHAAILPAHNPADQGNAPKKPEAIISQLSQIMRPTVR